jgi:hypothetical protein
MLSHWLRWGLVTFMPQLAWSLILHISTSEVARIIGVSHPGPTLLLFRHGAALGKAGWPCPACFFLQ